MAAPPFRVGVISDTHDYLDPRVPEIFAGVRHILHAGDIGMPVLILRLEDIAPVTAVLGNTDSYGRYNLTELVSLENRKFLLHHIVEPREPADDIRRRIAREAPDVVVFGHTHRRFCETLGKTLYLNPGYAGQKRFNLLRSVAILELDANGIRVEFREL
jgi:uncharacterized protein